MKLNPLEELVYELADDYVDQVFELAEDIAPYRPWYHVELKPDEQVMRYMSAPTTGAQSIRDALVTWLSDASPYMGWSSVQEAIDGLYRLFTDPAVPRTVPAVLLVDERLDVIREMVQAQGPRETASHIKRVERMAQRRLQASAMFTA